MAHPATTPHILIVEDIASLALSYSAQLKAAGYQTSVAESLEEADRILVNRNGDVSVILLDLQLPDGDGLKWFSDNKTAYGHIPVVVSTADSSLNRAIISMRQGAYDFLVKPVAPKRLLASVQSALTNLPVTQTPVEKAEPEPAFEKHFIGKCNAMRSVYSQIKAVADSRATVFITGESGTGKEVCAQAIHDRGARRGKPFIAVNCGAIPESLLESELFGHLKGSFTGAISDKIGAVQAANGGTLFLDEIGEMDIRLQVKLLRFLQTGTVQPVGSTKTQDVDVRIVCATNRDPLAEVQAGRFREDLYYRLAVVLIHLPPLRERGSDIMLLADHFLERAAEDEGKYFDPISGELAKRLLQHSWPGNVRELQNLIRRGVIMFPGPKLDEQLVDEFMPSPGSSVEPAADPHEPSQPQFSRPAAFASVHARSTPQLAEMFEGQSFDQIERDIIESFVDSSGGSIPKAAKQLGISASTIYRKKERWDG